MLMVNMMEKVSTFGVMELFILETLLMEKNKERVNGKVIEIIIYATLMKVSLNKIRKVVTVFSRGKVEMFIKENIEMLTEKVMEKCIGQMEAITMVNGIKTFKMDSVEWYSQTVQ